MSTPISPRMLEGNGGKKRSVKEQAEYVKLFRADNIGLFPVSGSLKWMGLMGWDG